jgi:hypothetical protein
MNDAYLTNWAPLLLLRQPRPLRAGGEQHRCPEHNVHADALDTSVFHHVRRHHHFAARIHIVIDTSTTPKTSSCCGAVPTSTGHLTSAFAGHCAGNTG